MKGRKVRTGGTKSVSKVPEIDVLTAVTIWLCSRGVEPIQFSLPHGKGWKKARIERTKKRLTALLRTKGVSGLAPKFASSGPDIVGIAKSECWQIECKGAGAGKDTTQRNNFDRALSSVVSYYSQVPPGLTRIPAGVRTYLGLALPSTTRYMSELVRRVGKPLRRKLNLWVLLYDPKSRTVRTVAPDDEY